MKRSLRCIHPVRATTTLTAIEATVRIDRGTHLVAEFSVLTRDRHVNAALSKRDPQWGLWDWDVVELFVHPLGRQSGLPYYEFQVSPLGQFFELEIFEPRVRVNRAYRSQGVFSAEDHGDRWSARMEIPLISLGTEVEPAQITGNIFAILGAPTRSYWSAFLGPQPSPDFHLPEFFAPLLRK